LRQPAFPMPHAKSTQLAATLAAITIFAMLLRAPFSFSAGIDEAFYLVVGRQWLNGLPPYAGSFDVKPPLLFLLMAGSEAVFGASLWAAKALATGAAAITACGLYLLGRRYFGTLAGAAAAIFYVVSTLPLGGAFAVAELLMAPFTTFGMVFGLAALFDRGRVRILALLASGLLFGAAACVKQTAVFEAAPLALGLLINRKGMARLRAPGTFAAAFCIVPFAFALYFSAIGHIEDFINAAAIGAIRRAGAGYVPWSEAFRLLSAGMLAILPIIAMAGIFWAERRPLRGQAAYPSALFLAAWAAGALLGALVTKALFVIYILPLLQPLCLAAGGFVQHVLGRIQGRWRRRAIRGGVLGAVMLYSSLFVAPLFLAGRSSLDAAEAAAALMVKAGKRPEDRILVVDRDILIYVAAGAEPPFPIFHPQQLLCNFPAPGAGAALADAMKNQPAFVIVADPPHVRVCEQKSRRMSLEAELARNYCPLGRFESSVTGWPGSFIVFGLKTRADAASTELCSRGLRSPPANLRKLDK